MTPPPPWRRAAGWLLPALLAGLGPSGAALAQTIATGARHGMALQADGSVLAWGDNRLAQLGQGKTVYASTAIEIPLPVKATTVRTSRTTALVLDEEGNVWSWGTNARGQLGDGTRADRATPQVVFRGAVSIANGGDSAPSFVIDKDGQPWWWGPLPSGVDAAVPERAAQVPARLVRIEHQLRATVALDEQGVVWTWGEDAACADSSAAASAPRAMRGVPPIVDFIFEAQGPINYQSAAIPARGPISRVTARDADGRLWVWGTDPLFFPPHGVPPLPLTHCPAERWAQAYDPFAARSRIHPEMEKAGVKLQKVIHGRDASLGWTGEGDLWQWQYMPTAEIPGGPYVAAERVASGVVDASGHNTALTGVLPVLMYITRDGKLHAMGSNTSLHLAIATDAAGGAESLASPRVLTLPSKAVSVHASEAASYALLKDGRVFRWGLGAVQYDRQASLHGASHAQTPTHIPLGALVTQLAAAQGQWLAVDANGKVWSSGNWGTSPVPHTRPLVVESSTGLPLARSVSVGGNGHGAILGRDGSVWAIGGSIDIIPAQSSDTDAVIRWSSVPRKLEGLPTTITQVATADGTYGALYALDASGTVWFWGARRRYGIAGQDSALLSRDQWIAHAPIVLPLPHKAVSIHAGDFNVCAVLQDGSAQCYGKLFNEHRGRRLQLHAPIQEISMGVDEDRVGTTATARRGGTVHLRLADGTVWAMGLGRQGQLGTGAYASSAEPIPVVNEAGTGDLDLAPSVPNIAATAVNRPPFRVKTQLAGNLRSLSLTGEVFGSAGTPPDAHVYALASAGPLGPGVWMQLDAQGAWSPLRWPVPAVASNAQLGSEAEALPLSLRPQQLQQGSDITGLRLYIGYGRDVDEMLAARRFREVLELGPDASGMVLPSDF